MSTFGLSMIFMKTNELNHSFQDVDEKKGGCSPCLWREVQARSNAVHLMGFRLLSGNRSQGDPLTRPAPADEGAGCGPPSPPKGRGL